MAVGGIQSMKAKNNLENLHPNILVSVVVVCYVSVFISDGSGLWARGKHFRQVVPKRISVPASLFSAMDLWFK